MSYQASLSQGVQQQSNTPEYDLLLGQGRNPPQTKVNFSENSPATNDWFTPHIAPLREDQEVNVEGKDRNEFRKNSNKPSCPWVSIWVWLWTSSCYEETQTLDIYPTHNDTRHLPVAQVMPNVPSTPPTRQHRMPSPRQHAKRDERPRKLFDSNGRLSSDGRRVSGGQPLLMHQRPPVEGMTVEPWDTRQDGYGDGELYLNDTTSQHFTIPHMEETMNQSAMVADMTLKPREKHHSGSSYRRRSSSVPPPPKDRRNSSPGGSEDNPSKAMYSDDRAVGTPMVALQMSDNIPKQQYSSSMLDYHSARKLQDLTSWQRTLNPRTEEPMTDQLKHLELTGPHRFPINQYSYPYDTVRDPVVAGLTGKYTDQRLLAGGVSSTLPAFGADVGNLGGLIQAKDRMLQEKTYQIERLKMDYNQLQEKTRELQVDDRRKLYAPSTSSSGEHSLDLLLMKLQEKDYEIFSLRNQLTQQSSSKDSEIDQLSRKLGQTEYETKKSQEKEKELQSSLKREIEKLSSQIKAKETTHEETKEKYKKMRDKYDKVKLKVQSLEHYLKDLPTADDYAKSSESIESLQRTEELLKQRITALESDLTETRNIRRGKELEISNLEEKNADLEFEIQSLKTELGKMQQALGVEDGTDPTSFKLCSRDEYDDITKEKERLVQEVRQLKKVADSKHKQIKKLQLQHQDQVREMEGRLMQEEDNAVGLREEIKNKEVDIAKMRKTLKDLAEQNQDLLSLKMTLHEKIKKQERVISSEKFQLNQRVAKELSECTKEMQNLVQVCLQSAEGSEPNVSMLLGIRSNSSMSVDEGHPTETEEEARKRLLGDLQQIRQNIDILRGHLSDKYAESVGNNCITQ